MTAITRLEINGFKAFPKEFVLDLYPDEPKNLLLYGENGSGKSSIYYALHVLLQSSFKDDFGAKYFKADDETNNEYLDEWPVRPYSKRELAMAYAPDISPSSALNRLAGWVRHHRRLSDELDETGYQNRQRIFTSLQVELIFRYLGRP